MQAVEELFSIIGVAEACRTMSVSRVTEYRTRKPAPKSAVESRAPRPRALTVSERAVVLADLASKSYADSALAAL